MIENFEMNLKVEVTNRSHILLKGFLACFVDFMDFFGTIMGPSNPNLWNILVLKLYLLYGTGGSAVKEIQFSKLFSAMTNFLMHFGNRLDIEVDYFQVEVNSRCV